MLARPRDEDSLITIATYPNPHEAHLDRAKLHSRGVPAFVHSDHGQYVSMASWVQLQVALRDREFAYELLEWDPFQMNETEKERSVDDGDDMRAARLKRRFVLARWFLYASALTLFSAGWIVGPLFVVPFGLALWSQEHPRQAFGIAYFLQIVVVFVSIALTGVSGLMALIPLLAYYCAWTGATRDPPEKLLASPYPRSRTIEIGEAWKGSEADREPTEPPIWVVRDLGVFGLVLLLIWAIRQALRLG